jgi:hypothetical protein
MSATTSGFGTFRTSHAVRLESAMRNKADIINLIDLSVHPWPHLRTTRCREPGR